MSDIKSWFDVVKDHEPAEVKNGKETHLFLPHEGFMQVRLVNDEGVPVILQKTNDQVLTIELTDDMQRFVNAARMHGEADVCEDCVFRLSCMAGAAPVDLDDMERCKCVTESGKLEPL